MFGDIQTAFDVFVCLCVCLRGLPVIRQTYDGTLESDKRLSSRETEEMIILRCWEVLRGSLEGRWRVERGSLRGDVRRLAVSKRSRPSLRMSRDPSLK